MMKLRNIFVAVIFNSAIMTCVACHQLTWCQSKTDMVAIYIEACSYWQFLDFQ